MADGWLETPFDLSGKRVFVAGHRGLVGSSVIRRLQKEDCEVLTSPVDFTDQKQTRDWILKHRPDVVIMAAARVGGILANQTRPAEFFTDNILIQTNIMQAVRDVEKLVFLGSSCIYPKDAQQPICEEALLTGPLEPTSEAYALAKIAGIKMAQSYRKQYGCDFISLMPCNLYGPGDKFNAVNSHVIPALMMRAHEAKLRGGDLTVWGSGRPRREFLYAPDLADALVFALKNYSSEKPLNIGAGTDITIAALAEKICDAVGFQGDIVFDEAKPDGVAAKLMDSSRIYKAGWKPQTSLESGLAQTYEWFLEHEYSQAA